MKHSLFLWIVCAGGLFLLVSPAFNRWRVRWPKTALCIAGIMAESYVVLGFVDRNIGQQDRWFSLLSHMQSVIGGIAIGLLVAFELFDLLDRRRYPEHANPA